MTRIANLARLAHCMEQDAEGDETLHGVEARLSQQLHRVLPTEELCCSKALVIPMQVHPCPNEGIARHGLDAKGRGAFQDGVVQLIVLFGAV